MSPSGITQLSMSTPAALARTLFPPFDPGLPRRSHLRKVVWHAEETLVPSQSEQAVLHRPHPNTLPGSPAPFASAARAFVETCSSGEQHGEGWPDIFFLPRSPVLLVTTVPSVFCTLICAPDEPRRVSCRHAAWLLAGWLVLQRIFVLTTALSIVSAA